MCPSLGGESQDPSQQPGVTLVPLVSQLILAIVETSHFSFVFLFYIKGRI